MKRERGFTLLEVLIAFSIAAIGLFALFRGAGSGIENARVAAQYEEALSRARSHLASLETSLQPGEQSGDDGGVYRWRLAVAPVAVADTPQADRTAPIPVLYNVTVAISWTAEGGAREVSLATRRLGRLAPSAP